MAQVQFPNYTSRTGPIPITRNTVYVKRNWSDNWVAVPHLRPLSVQQTLGPNVSRATFMWPFGTKFETTYTAKQTKLPYFTKDYFVRVDASVRGARTTVFIGIFSDDELEIDDNQSTYTGYQRMVAYGLDHLLEKIYLDDVWINDAIGTRKIPGVPGLNERQRIGQSYAGNRSATIPAGRSTYVFGSGGTWSNLEFIQYLLAEIQPKGITFNLSGVYSVLADLKIQARLEQTTVKSMLDILIPRQRGHGYMVRWDIDGNIFLDIVTVMNTQQTSVTVGAATVNANPRKVFVNLDSFGQYPVETRIVSKSSVKHEKIIVEGERLKICGTFDMATGTLEKGWETSEITTYGDIDESDADKTDQARQSDAYKHILQKFVIPDDWDGILEDVSDVGFVGDFPNQSVSILGDRHYIGFPAIDDDGIFDATTANSQLLNIKNCRVLRDLPFQSEGGTSDGGNEFQKPLAYVRERTLQEGSMQWNGYYHPIHIPYAGYGVENTGPKVAARIIPLDNAAGIQVDYPVPHVLGLAYGENGNSVIGGETNYTPIFDAFDLFATLFIETDRRVRVTTYREGYDATTATTAMKLYVEGAETWYVAPKTVYGVSSDGNIATKQTASTAQFIRNDVPKLQTVAALANAWFSEDRQAVELTIKGGVFQAVWPGDVIVEVNSTSGSERIGTMVSSITMDFAQGQGQSPSTTITTGYFEFDPSAIFNYSTIGDFQAVGREIQSMRGDVARIQQHISAIPARQAPGGGGGTGSATTATTTNLLVGGWCVS